MQNHNILIFKRVYLDNHNLSKKNKTVNNHIFQSLKKQKYFSYP